MLVTARKSDARHPFINYSQSEKEDQGLCFLPPPADDNLNEFRVPNSAF